jgi:hypothetical protein
MEKSIYQRLKKIIKDGAIYLAMSATLAGGLGLAISKNNTLERRVQELNQMVIELGRNPQIDPNRIGFVKRGNHIEGFYDEGQFDSNLNVIIRYDDKDLDELKVDESSLEPYNLRKVNAKYDEFGKLKSYQIYPNINQVVLRME